MKDVNGSVHLTRQQRSLRIAASGALALAFIVLRVVNPETLAWLPFRPSCGAVTGLPCIFCGTTRAIHRLLQGDFAGALYFNWLAFPIVLCGGTLAIVFAFESAAGRRLVARRLQFRLTRRFAALAGSALVALWIVQVSLAVTLHKHELLNPSGLLYRLFVR